MPNDLASQPLALFPEEVQSLLEHNRELLGCLARRWPMPLDRSAGELPTVYDGHPYLFLEAFEGLSREEVAPLALAARLFASAVLVADDVMDDPLTPGERLEATLRVQALHCEGYQLLYRLIPAEDPFWARLRTCLSDYAYACVEERSFADGVRKWGDFDDARALRIARDKGALARFPVAALAAMSGEEAPVEPLTESVACYYAARQMVDDLADWREDFELGTPSLLLVRAVRRRFDGDRSRAIRCREALVREIFQGGHAHAVLDIARRSLDQALRLSAPFPDLAWRRALAHLDGHCVTLVERLDRLVAGDGDELVAAVAAETAPPRPGRQVSP